MGVRFELQINGQQICVAGIDGSGVMTLTLTRVQNSPGDYSRTPRRRRPSCSLEEFLREDIRLHLGGLLRPADLSGDGSHVVWHGQELGAGDEVLIRVLPDGEIDPPLRGGESNG